MKRSVIGCAQCFRSFKQRRLEQIYCGRECALAYRRKFAPKGPRYCRICLNLYRPAFHVKKGTCSAQCGWILRRLTCKPRLRKPRAIKVKKVKVVHHFYCANCRCSVQSTTRKKYCSLACSSLVSWRTQKHKRRARIRSGERGDSIDMPTLLERDKYRCGLCQDKINPRLSYPHDQCATIDHIIPLSRGGSHTWRNVQAAHHRCNQEKRCEPMGQLRIC